GHRAALDLIHLHIPWWNPYGGTGTPLAGEMQSAALFPPTLLTLLSNGQVYEHMLLELLAGVATYLLLRRIGLGRLASTIGAVAYALNGTFAWFAHATVNPIPFLPLLLLGIELAYGAAIRRQRGGWWLIAVAAALSFYAGFPEVAYIDTLLALCWLAWRARCAGRAHLAALARKIAAGAGVALLLAAPLLIAMLDFFGHAEIPLHSTSYFGSVHLPAQGLPQLLLPYVYGPIFAYANQSWGNIGGYLTTSILLLSLVGLSSRRLGGLRLALVIWLVLALSRTYDQPHLLGSVLGVLPGMSSIAFARYTFAALELPVIVLSAIAVDDLARSEVPVRRLALCATIALALIAASAIGAGPLAGKLGSAFRHHHYFAASVAWGVLVVVLATLLALLRRPPARALAVGLVIVVDGVLLFGLPQLSAPRNLRLDLAPVNFLQRHLGQSRFATLGPLQPNYGAYFGVSSINLSDGAVPRSYAHFVGARLNPFVAPTLLVGRQGAAALLFALPSNAQVISRLSGYRAASVAYFLVAPSRPLPTSAGGFHLVFRSPSALIYRLAGAAPYFSAAGCVVTPDGVDAARLSCSHRSTLTRRETYLPGWSASVDGRAVSLRRTDGPFQSVAVGAGAHRVSFSYQPPHVVWGWLALALGCASLAASLLGRVRNPAGGGTSGAAVGVQ